MIAAFQAIHARHANVIRVVVLYEILRPRGPGNRGLQFFRQGDHLFPRILAASAGKNSDVAAFIELLDGGHQRLCRWP